MWFRTKQGVEYKVNDQQVVKMTREDAVKKIVEKLKSTDAFANQMVDMLIELGVMKVEEKSIQIEIFNVNNISFTTDLYRISSALYRHGFKVIKI